ncbi:hypothetical protein LY76DRAFT_650730 [Colletotrichum caudatum]|nr:hypothetical protein LY76DRAFT_650730 [Colletotrichum caudatum]
MVSFCRAHSQTAPQVAGLAAYYRSMESPWMADLGELGEVGENGRTALTPGRVKKLIRKFHRRFNVMPENGDAVAANDASKKRPSGGPSCLRDYAVNGQRTTWSRNNCPDIHLVLDNQADDGETVAPCETPSRRSYLPGHAKRQQDGGGGSCPLLLPVDGSLASGGGGGSPPPYPPEAHRRRHLILALQELSIANPMGLRDWDRSWLVFSKEPDRQFNLCGDHAVHNDETSTPWAMAGYLSSISLDTVEGLPCSEEDGLEGSVGRISCPGISDIRCESLDEIAPCGVRNSPTIKAGMYCSWG